MDSSYVKKRSFKDLQKQTSRRAVLIAELMSSEQTHVEALKTVVVEHLNPLKSILSKDVIKKLFGNFEVIVGWNMQFLIRLKARYEESEEVDFEQYGYVFGDIMVEMLVILRQLYAQYSENYELAQQTYKECLKIREFEQFIQNQSKTNLLHSLYLPIGRMIMYDSLLKEIVKLTPKNHLDYEDLLNAQKLIVAATKQADRVVEKRKNMENVLRIQSLLSGVDIAEPHRRYVYEGDVYLVVGHNKPNKNRSLILFNDILLLVKPRKKKFDIAFLYELRNIEVVDDEESRSSFQIRNTEHDINWVLESEDKQTWLQMLNSTIKKLGSTPQEINALRDEDESVNTNYLENDNEKSLTKAQLMEKILEWSEMKKEDILPDIKATAEIIKKMYRKK